MRRTIALALAAIIALPLVAAPAEAGWKKRGYSSGYSYRHGYRPRYAYRGYGYRRPYYGRRYYDGYSPGEAAVGLLLGVIALSVANAAINANQQPVAPYGYAPAYLQPRGPLPAGAVGIDTNGQPVCIGGPDRC